MPCVSVPKFAEILSERHDSSTNCVLLFEIDESQEFHLEKMAMVPGFKLIERKGKIVNERQLCRRSDIVFSIRAFTGSIERELPRPQ